jgi:hypothetical protein
MGHARPRCLALSRCDSPADSLHLGCALLVDTATAYEQIVSSRSSRWPASVSRLGDRRFVGVAYDRSGTLVVVGPVQ